MNEPFGSSLCASHRNRFIRGQLTVIETASGPRVGLRAPTQRINDERRYVTHLPYLLDE
jgi:hypothetical protein